MSYEVFGDNDDTGFEAAIEAGWIDPNDLSNAMRDVIDERERQGRTEGWSLQHDDAHDKGELALAGAAYAHMGGVPDRDAANFALDFLWPFSRDWWKPKDRRRDLVRAAALIVAEIERLDRRAASSGGSSPA